MAAGKGRRLSGPCQAGEGLRVGWHLEEVEEWLKNWERLSS
jgi:hypothetical protein